MKVSHTDIESTVEVIVETVLNVVDLVGTRMTLFRPALTQRDILVFSKITNTKRGPFLFRPSQYPFPSALTVLELLLILV